MGTGFPSATRSHPGHLGAKTVLVLAAARLVQRGDKVIIVTYCQIEAEMARNYAPTVVLLDEKNGVKKAA